MAEESGPFSSESIKKRYGLGGELDSWNTTELERHPHLPEAYANLLVAEGLLPVTSETASGFTFFSPSANQGLYEYTIAKKVNDSLSERPTTPPVFIAADIFGLKERDTFVPGFEREMYKSEDLEKVIFQKMSADAKRIPLRDRSVTMIWDRVGALWHTQYQSLLEQKDREATAAHLAEYERLLTPNGCIIIDASDDGASTLEFLEKGHGTKVVGQGAERLQREIDARELPFKINLQSLGWEVCRIGQGETGLAVLKRKVSG